jgi:hydrogenase expression/formation protein HypD
MNNIGEIIDFLKGYAGPEIKLMEVCGTHTDSIFKNGIRSLISPSIKLISGPGCPVCVTPAAYIDKACELALKEGYRVYTFGDMMRVTGSKGSLAAAKAEGADVRIMYSPLELLDKAEEEAGIIHVVAAVGFETTVPAYGLLVEKCLERGLGNIKLLTSLKGIFPALDLVCRSNNDIDGFLCPGHVSVVTGETMYEELGRKYGKPFAISGFTAEHILVSIYDLIKQLEHSSSKVHNLYRSVVRQEGNPKAAEMIDRYFEKTDAVWRGLGVIEGSGYRLKEEYTDFNIEYDDSVDEKLINGCSCGEVIMGKMNPNQCRMFGSICTPQNPMGPCMVSAEGSCGIWFKHRGDR